MRHDDELTTTTAPRAANGGPPAIATDVAVVGGGFAGAALATVLARGGRDVVVLERQTAFTDRSRGEWIAPWGVAEAMRLGLFDDLRRAGGHVVRSLEVRERDHAPGDGFGIDLTACSPLADGALSIRLESACDELLRAAERAGARVLRSHIVRELDCGRPRGRSSIRGVAGERPFEVRCRHVVAADSGSSTMRRMVGLGFSVQPRDLWGAGLLVSDVDVADDRSSVVVSTDDAMAYLLPQGQGMARLYVNIAGEASREVFGEDRVAGFLRIARHALGAPLAAARPAGPCFVHPLRNGVAAGVCASGVVFVGDAAGFTNPVAGQGLAMALRDVRVVTDAMDRGRPDPSFVTYGRERARRMAILCAAVPLYSAMVASFGPGGRARRHDARVALGAESGLAELALSAFRGPFGVRAGETLPVPVG